jgi:predicted site-specific integrase-resolvase
MYVPARKFQELYGVSIITLRRWADSGRIESIRSPGNQRLYKIREEGHEENRQRKKYVYVRVSSAKQKDDLERQRAHMVSRFPNHEVVSDVGSGINWRRKGLLSILDAAMLGNVEEVVVASRDRLCRFAFELLEHVFQNAKTRLVVLESTDSSPEQELSDDLLSIVQIFCCRRNGKRRYRSHCDAPRETESDDGPEKALEQVC